VCFEVGSRFSQLGAVISLFILLAFFTSYKFGSGEMGD
jgi:hypothetical protein